MVEHTKAPNIFGQGRVIRVTDTELRINFEKLRELSFTADKLPFIRRVSGAEREMPAPAQRDFQPGDFVIHKQARLEWGTGVVESSGPDRVVIDFDYGGKRVITREAAEKHMDVINETERANAQKEIEKERASGPFTVASVRTYKDESDEYAYDYEGDEEQLGYTQDISEGKPKVKKEEDTVSDSPFGKLEEKARQIENVMSPSALDEWLDELNNECKEDEQLTDSIFDIVEQTLKESLAYVKVLTIRPADGVVCYGYQHRNSGKALSRYDPLNVERKLETFAPSLSGKDPETLGCIHCFDRFIELNFNALRLLSSPEDITNDYIKLALQQAREMAVFLIRIKTADEDWTFETDKVNVHQDYVQPIVSVAQKLTENIQDRILGRSEYEVTSREFSELILDLPERVQQASDVTSLHSFINYLHQEAIRVIGEELGNYGDSHLWEGIFDAHGIRVIDLTEGSVESIEKVQQRALKILNESLSVVGVFPPILQVTPLLILHNDDAWLHLPIFEHTARLHFNFGPMAAQGGIHINYVEGSDGAENEARIELFEGILERLGMRVSVRGVNLEAVFSKDEACFSIERLEHIAALVLRMFIFSSNLDFYILQAKVEDMIDLFIEEESLRYYILDCGAGRDGLLFAKELKGIVEKEQQSPGNLRRELNERLRMLGLASIPESLPMTQAVIDRYYNKPILSLLEADLITPGNIEQPAEDLTENTMLSMADKTVGYIQRNPREALEMGRLSNGLDDYIEFSPIAMIGGYIVEQGFIRPFSKYTVAVKRLRYLQSQEATYAVVQQGGKFLDPQQFSQFVQSMDWVLPPMQTVLSEDADRAQKRLIELPSPDILGIIGSSTVVARTYERTTIGQVAYLDQKEPAGENTILVAPYTTPADLPKIREASAIVTTNPNELAHAAIVCRELGIPNAAITGVWRGNRLTVSKYAFDETNTGYVAAGREGDIRVVWGLAVERVALQPGDYLILDYELGTFYIEPMGQSIIEISNKIDSIRTGMSSDTSWLRSATLDESGWRFLLMHFIFDRSLPRSFIIELLGSLKRHEDRWRRVEPWIMDVSLSKETEWQQTVANRISTASSQQDILQAVSFALKYFEKAVDVLDRLGYHEEVLDMDGYIGQSLCRAIERSYVSRAVSHKPQEQECKVSAKPFILFADEISSTDKGLVGGKGLELAELSHINFGDGIETQPFFVVTTQALRSFLDESLPFSVAKRLGIEELASRGLKDVLAEVVHTANHYDDMADRLHLARSVITETPFPEGGLRKVILDAFEQVIGGDLAAVRSSSLQEDSRMRSHAGMYDSVLGVGRDKILEKIKSVWASQFNERLFDYLGAEAFESEEAFFGMSVIVQTAGPAEVSGVFFSQDPNSPGEKGALIRATYGLGLGVVDGTAACDRYRLDLETGELVEKPILMEKTQAYCLSDKDGVERRDIPLNQQRHSTLSDEHFQLFVRMAQAMKSHYQEESDVEFIIISGKLIPIQRRPITPIGKRLTRTDMVFEQEKSLDSTEVLSILQPYLATLERYPSLRIFTARLKEADWNIALDVFHKTSKDYNIRDNRVIIDRGFYERLMDKRIDVSDGVSMLLELAADYIFASYDIGSAELERVKKGVVKKWTLYERLRNGKRKLNVMYLCVGNHHRSPLLQYALFHQAEQAGLSHLLEVESRGTLLGKTVDIDQHIIEAGERVGLACDLASHIRREVTSDDLDGADILIAADERVVDDILRLGAYYGSKLLLWGETTNNYVSFLIGGLYDPASVRKRSDEVKWLQPVIDLILFSVGQGFWPDLQVILQGRMDAAASDKITTADAKGKDAISPVTAKASGAILIISDPSSALQFGSIKNDLEVKGIDRDKVEQIIVDIDTPALQEANAEAIETFIKELQTQIDQIKASRHILLIINNITATLQQGLQFRLGLLFDSLGIPTATPQQINDNWEAIRDRLSAA